MDGAPDVVAENVRRQLPPYLVHTFKVDAGIAESIGIAIKWAIKAAEWIWL